jgi:two-component system osmolarity sensor histidine kinase EnvZ
LLAELADLEGLHVYPADADDRVEPPPSFGLMHRIEALLIEKLGPETQLAFAVNGEPGLFVRFRVLPGEDGHFWLGLPRERLARHLPWQWIGWGLAVLLLSLAGAWLIVYRIVRPIEEERALLLAGISHDLRTPLTRLRMEIEMSVADEAARSGMEADIVEMDRTIGQFLDFARPVERRPAEPADLAALLRDITARYQKPGGRLTSADISEMIVPVRVAALRRAIINLIENALRHSGSEAPVELTLRREGRHAVIAILDRGPGIAPADIERLKQPFTRGEAARTGAGGAGLGLAIVDRLVRLQGGRLELSPRPGGGLAARIILSL